MTSTTTSKRRRLSFWSGILLLVNIGVLFLLAAGFIAAYVRPDEYWMLAFAGLIFPYAVLANLFFVITWMALWKRLFLVSLIALLLCWGRLNNYIQFWNDKDPLETDNQPIKVMSYNVQIFDLYNWQNNRISEKGHNILRLIEKERPDFLCLQEYHAGRKNKIEIADSIKTLLDNRYSHISYVNNGDKVMPYGIATFSRWPIINKEEFRFENNPMNFCIASDIVVDKDTIRLFNLHLESIRLSKEDYLYVEELPKNADSQDLFSENSKKILRKFKRAFINRTPQAVKIREYIDSSPYPVVVCGDFNDTPSSFTYHHISENLTDAFKESGNGIGMTYAGSLPSFRIDYILHNKNFKSVDFETLRLNYSDHYPVLTGIIFPK